MFDDVAVFKLVTGEEMLARVESEDDSSWKLIKPMTLVPSQQGLALTPGMFTAQPEKSVLLFKNAVVMKCIPRQEMLNSYIEGTTGIKPITKPDILLG